MGKDSKGKVGLAFLSEHLPVKHRLSDLRKTREFPWKIF